MDKAYSSESYGFSDIGLVRTNNEDEYLLLPDWNFFALADGIGGHRAGDVAAKKTLEVLSENLIEELTQKKRTVLSTRNFTKQLKRLICSTNRWIYELSKDHESLNGMGTTLCCLYLHANRAIYAHVGDSRVYLFRNQKLKQLTQDHSLLQRWIQKGKLKADEMLPSSRRNIITKAVGIQKSIDPEISSESLQDQDIFFLCTDGLSDYVSKEEIEEMLLEESNLSKCVNKLIETAKEKGSHDNITALIVRVSKNDLFRQ